MHISCLANSFITDPHLVVKTGDIVHVKVIALDFERKRISLSMRLQDKVIASMSHNAQIKPRLPLPKQSAPGCALVAVPGKQK